MKKEGLGPDDVELFRQAIGEVKPIVDDRTDSSTPAPKAIPKQLERDEQQAIQDLLSDHYDPSELNEADSIQFHRPGLQHSVFAKIKTWPIQCQC